MYGRHLGWDFPWEKNHRKGRNEDRQDRAARRPPAASLMVRTTYRSTALRKRPWEAGAQGTASGQPRGLGQDAGEPPVVEAHEWNHENNTFFYYRQRHRQNKTPTTWDFFLLREKISVCRRFYSIRLNFFKISTLRIDLFWFFRFCEPCLSENIPVHLSKRKQGFISQRIKDLKYKWLSFIVNF